MSIWCKIVSPGTGSGWRSGVHVLAFLVYCKVVICGGRVISSCRGDVRSILWMHPASSSRVMPGGGTLLWWQTGASSRWLLRDLLSHVKSSFLEQKQLLHHG